MFDSLGGLGEIWSRETYDADKPNVVLTLRISLIAAMACFIGGAVLSVTLP